MTPTSARPHSAAKVLLATAAYAAVHSLLASDAAKSLATRLAGRRNREAHYRLAFNAQSTIGLAALAWWGARLPDRELWRVRGAVRGALHLAQLGGAVFGWRALRAVGVARFAGVPGAAAWAARAPDIPPEATGQGPVPDADGAIRAHGPFAASRHPLNAAMIPILWGMPVMTANLAAFNAVATLHLVLGSWHEEVRLRRAYGARYEAYRRSGVPFYVPRALPRRLG